VLVLAVSLLAVAMVALALALRRVQQSPTTVPLAVGLRSAHDAAADLDRATDEFRAAVDGRTDR